MLNVFMIIGAAHSPEAGERKNFCGPTAVGTLSCDDYEADNSPVYPTIASQYKPHAAGIEFELSNGMRRDVLYCGLRTDIYCTYVVSAQRRKSSTSS